MINVKTPAVPMTDENLVSASLAGDQQAFAQIVARYQRLLCSLAYSALGSINESEDVAQEAFVEAWKKLGELREPHKLKSWLCGILRFKISHHRRKASNHADNNSQALANSNELETGGEALEEVAMKEQQQALMWQALQNMPDTYRDTLVLYYRENQSSEQVAQALDISEDTVKQRLSRGRKLLQAKVLSLVEDGLSTSAPGHVFTAGVVAALASVPVPVKASGVGFTAAKLGSTLKLSAISAFFVTLSGLVSALFALKASLAQSKTPLERRAAVITVLIILAAVFGFVLCLLGLRTLAVKALADPLLLTWISQIMVIAFFVGFWWLMAAMMKNIRTIRASEKRRRPDLFSDENAKLNAKGREYISRFTLLGVPLIHIKLAIPEKGDSAAFGWFAFGQKAYALLFAWGGIAVAPISVGAVAFGLFPIGAVTFGLIAVGTVSIGWFALGVSAIGYKALGSMSALGWDAAFSYSFSVAKHAAIGPIAYAEQINDEVASSLLSLSSANDYFTIAFGIMAVMILIPSVLYARVVKRKGENSPNH